MEYSAKQTLKYLCLKNVSSNFLLAIPPDRIGGAMVVVRSIISGGVLYFTEPKSLPESDQAHFSLTALVPLQVRRIAFCNPSFFMKTQNVLIGGGALEPTLEKQLMTYPTQFYHSYGMTETASHVALRKLGDKSYHALGDVRFRQNKERLVLKGTISNHNWLQTNDLIKLQSETSFKWIGRSDFIINSGGHKVVPEKVEKLLSRQLTGKFAISSVPDVHFGEKVVFVSSQAKTTLILEHIHEFDRPKKFFWEFKIPYLSSGKIDRLGLRKLLSISNDI